MKMDPMLAHTLLIPVSRKIKVKSFLNISTLTDQLAEIKKVSLAGLVCNNYDLTTIPNNVFLNPSSSNTLVTCSSIKNQIDFSKWTRTL